MVRHPGFGQMIASLEGARRGGFDMGGFTSPGSALTRPGYMQPAQESARHYILMDRAEFSRAMQEDSTAHFHDIAARVVRRNG
jgi:hypothetical protein